MIKSFSDEYYPNKPKKLEYFIVWLLVAITGFTYFYFHAFFYWMALVIVVTVQVYWKRSLTFSNHFLIVTGAFLILELLQGVFFGFMVLSILNILSRLLFVYFILEYVGLNLVYHYIRLMYFLAWFSLIVYASLYIDSVKSLLVQLGNDIFQPLFYYDNPVHTISPNIILYTFNPSCMGSPLRNSGPFWEPGGFAVFLIFALIFNLMIKKKLLSKINIILIITIVTTLSTAGYIGLFIIIVGYIVCTKLLLIEKIMIIAPISVLIIVLWQRLDFLESKVETNRYESYTTTSRFGSAVEDLIMVQNNMFIGTGRNFTRIFKTERYDIGMHRNNGITIVLRQYGIPFFIFYFYLLFSFLVKIIRRHNFQKTFAFFAFLSILSVGFGQTVFLLPFPLILIYAEEKHFNNDGKL